MPRGAPVDRSHVDKYLADDPTKRMQNWREVLSKAYWDHPFHPMKERMPIPDYRALRTTSSNHGEPWRLMSKSMGCSTDGKWSTLLEAPQSSFAGSTSSAPAASFDGAFTRGVGRNPLEKAHISRTLKSTGSSATFGAQLATLQCKDGTTSAPAGGSRSRSAGTAGWRHSQHEQPRACAAGVASSRSTMPSFARVVGV
mmetsp:Transcript_28891/g.66568  ORF Transcript_28891/g.66568 Transcript_28891/m.66568 type:complete len:198 (+) Transcript_28891:78-671(+)